MTNMRGMLRALAVVACVAGGAAAGVAEEEGFKSLFDGKTLDGWKAPDMSYWSVQDGAITGKITAEHPLKVNQYLIWQGEQLADFEIKMTFRMTGSPGINGGFQYRSKLLPDNDIAGYQMDNNLNTDWLCRLYHEHGRDTLAMRGIKAVFDESGKATRTAIPDAGGAAWFKLEDWHEYHLICQGPHMILKVNGRLAAEVIDNDPKQQAFVGILGLQLHSGPPTVTQFKDIRLKVLKAAKEPVPPLAAQPPQPVPGAQAKPDPALPAVRDKTLVAWVAPASLTQRGGSALTIDDCESHFDGVVFGELAPKRWMAGSNGFSRSQKDQAAWPEETADPKTLVQVAIAYKDRQVTILRDGKQAAQYDMGSAPQEFGSRSVLVLGMRHLDQNDDAHFAGTVQDARVYDVALSAEQIAALKPLEPSGPKPWAWLTFEDKSPKDRTGRLAAVRLIGGAKVEGGRLVLDGLTGVLLAARTPEDLARLLGTTTPVPPADIDAARALREHLLADPYRPRYHFVILEGYAMPFDPNGAIFWKGRYHLFYIFQDKRGHNWGHISSTDLVHWRHHLTGLVGGMFSGNCFINKDGRPTMCYHQVGQGNAMAVAVDDELNEWKKLESNPITPKTAPGDPHHGKYQSWDPCGWLEGNTYYAIFGGTRPAIAKADRLEGEWKYVGDLMANTVAGVSINEDVSCADLFKLGDKHMLLCISHRLGARYYLGQWKDEQFHPEFHERMSWVDNAFFAPESCSDSKGRRIMWAWIFDQRGNRLRQASGWSGEMSLPRELSLGQGGGLRMRPAEELKQLRYNEQTVENLTVEADKDVLLEKLAGNTIELAVEIDPQDAKQCGLKVCRSPDGAEQTLVYYDAADKKLKIDVTKASLGEGPKNVEAGPFELKQGETLTLRVFVDKSVVEAFANDRQAAMRRIYPTRPDSLGVSLFSQGGAAKVRRVTAWEMMPSNPY